MLDEGTNIDVEGGTPPPAEESSNRTFLIVGGILAAIVLLTIICMAVYVVLTLPARQAQRAAEQTAIATQNLGLQMAMTATAEAALWTPTLPPTATPAPVTPTATPVVAMPSSSPTPDSLPLTQTMAYLRTQVEINRLTPTGTLGMPRSGFADEVGLPGLVILALALVVVILLARRLRAAPVKK
jgi:hypothetical protein